MDQCDSKIDLVNICGSVNYISWFIDFALYHCHRLELFLYIKKWHRCNRPEFPPSQFFPRGKTGPAHSFPGEKTDQSVFSPSSQFFPPLYFFIICNS